MGRIDILYYVIFIIGVANLFGMGLLGPGQNLASSLTAALAPTLLQSSGSTTVSSSTPKIKITDENDRTVSVASDSSRINENGKSKQTDISLQKVWSWIAWLLWMLKKSELGVREMLVQVLKQSCPEIKSLNGESKMCILCLHQRKSYKRKLNIYPILLFSLDQHQQYT